MRADRFLRVAPRTASILAAVALSACAADHRFRLSDETYEPRPAAEAPALFSGEPSPERYRVVGLIDLYYEDGTSGAAVMERAALEGQKVGCTALFFRKPTEDDVQVTDGPQTMIGNGVIIGSGPSVEITRRARFFCALRTAAH
jgi:hypothetical protein